LVRDVVPAAAGARPSLHDGEVAVRRRTEAFFKKIVGALKFRGNLGGGRLKVWCGEDLQVGATGHNAQRLPIAVIGERERGCAANRGAAYDTSVAFERFGLRQTGSQMIRCWNARG